MFPLFHPTPVDMAYDFSMVSDLPELLQPDKSEGNNPPFK
jgi:hypothetical protein